MLRNFIKVFWASLLRQKFIACINIIGLVVGFVTCILFGLFVRHELAYDSQWNYSSRLVRVIKINHGNIESLRKLAGVETAVLPALLEYFPDQIETGVRFFFLLDSGPVSWYVDGLEHDIQVGIAAVDADFTRLFDLEVLQGSLEDTFQQPYRLALPDDVALQLFGDQDAVGKVVGIGGEAGQRTDYEVTAVFRKPQLSKVQLAPFSLLDASVLGGDTDLLNSWSRLGEYYSYLYLLLKEGVELDEINAQLGGFIDQKMPGAAGVNGRASDLVGYEFQKLTDIHLHPLPVEQSFLKVGDINQVIAYGIIAILVLLIGVVNYSIIAYARSIERRRELALRKVAGSGKMNLLIQHAGESLLFVLIALGLALALAELLLPAFSLLAGIEIKLSYQDYFTWMVLALMLVLATLCGCIYPVFVLSRLKPQEVLRAGGVTSLTGVRVRSLLIVFQYAMTIVLLIATMVVYLQLNYLRKRDMGFDPYNILSVSAGSGENWEAMLNEIRLVPGVLEVSSATGSVNSAGSIVYPMSLYRHLEDENLLASRMLPVAPNYFDLFHIQLVAGRLFSKALDPDHFAPGGTETDDKGNRLPARVVVNQSLVRALGFDSEQAALEQTFWFKNNPAFTTGTQYQIIGVVADTQIMDVRKPAEPVFYSMTEQRNAVVLLRYADGAGSSVREEIEKIRLAYDEVYPPVFDFAADSLRAEFEPEANQGRLLLILSLLATTVSCLGLYGVVAFETRRRLREIGIRKVLGAEVKTVVALFSRQFSIPVLLANILAWPLATWAMLKWLQNFSYQLDHWLLLPLCLAAAALTLLIAMLTVSATAARAANTKPVQVLHHD